ncbi:flagellar biosynthesis protein FlhF [Rubinisphaera italica]|uniref:Flagellar biosynthesis protein FlhF n=1 Tax=Rubinisphaera italica TaxID=2527969 RepID=A0A5C5XLR0_9PLAN|nr:flagellar biosynthesis protein FlhF [Rubinisphaera italica]TWT63333.1 Flagellar biosynthesis protein FlhF [Rubinisphaera italica]
MPDFRTYRAETMQQALLQVREDLGPDALILHTRQVPIHSRLPWQKDRIVTEIVAVLEQKKRERPQPVAAVKSTSSTREQSEETPAPDLSAYNRKATLPVQESRLPIVESRLPRNEPINSEPAPPATPNPETPNPSPELSESQKLESLFKERIDSLQAMVEQLTSQVRTGMSTDIPPELFSLFTELIDAEVEESVARELIGRLKHRSGVNELSDSEGLRRQLFAMIEASIQCRGPIETKPGQQKIVAMVGPTGVGKTTTIAKLAANFRLRDNVRMGLITVDTYRIAAVDQLRTYAEIIDLPMKVVSTAVEMKQAVAEFAGMDLILIDTAGRSPRDEVKLQELKAVLGDIVVDDVHLVLSATTGYRHLRTTAEQFKSVGLTSVILTKLDEAPGLGAILNITSKLGLPLSYLTTGQNVPKDIEPAQPTRATRLILGQENLS